MGGWWRLAPPASAHENAQASKRNTGATAEADTINPRTRKAAVLQHKNAKHEKIGVRAKCVISLWMGARGAPEERQDNHGHNDAWFASIPQRNVEKAEVEEKSRFGCRVLNFVGPWICEK